MHAAKFRTIRMGLGVTGDWLAKTWNVEPRTVRHWEQGKYRVPDGIARELWDLWEFTARHVEAEVARLSVQPWPSHPVYRSDEQITEPSVNARPQRWGFALLPHGWHTLVSARVLAQVSELRLRWPTREWRTVQHTWAYATADYHCPSPRDLILNIVGDAADDFDIDAAAAAVVAAYQAQLPEGWKVIHGRDTTVVCLVDQDDPYDDDTSGVCAVSWEHVNVEAIIAAHHKIA